MRSTHDQTLLTARETAGRLGIKLDTLYAYVSRGLLHSVEVPGSRERQYDAEEIDRFRASRGAARFGEPRATVIPVIDSAICTIENGRYYYRGVDAIQLSEAATLEEVAALLWEADTATNAPPVPAVASGAFEETGVVERCQSRLAILSATDFTALDLSRAGVIRTGRAIVAALAGCVAGQPGDVLPVHVRLATSWRLGEAGTDLVRRCLVLLADHELNASAFVARCIASTGATPYAVVTGALSALSGRRHGGASARAEAMFRELLPLTDPLPAMAARLARDETLPAIGQPLYPDGDPRATAIIAAAMATAPQRSAWIDAVANGATRLTGQQPNVDFGLGLAAAVLGLPAGAAVSMFLVARSVGWIAHALEQYESNVLIRPRARYTGRRPIR